MDYLPLFFDFRARSCLIVGGGEIAYRKAELLHQAGARITVVAPDISSELLTLLETGRHIKIERVFGENDLQEVSLVVCATDDRELNEEVSRLAQKQSIPVNVVDNIELSTVIFPAIVDRSPVIIAVSTGGKSPVLARKIREMLETLMPAGIARLAVFLGEQRQRLKQRFPNPDNRRRVTETFLTSPGEELAIQGNFDAALEYLEKGTDNLASGEVYLVGAGPGDPDLLTLKALQLMQKADVVLYDNLVSEEVLSRVRRDARLENVGKTEKSTVEAQQSINQSMIQLAKTGARVLRLKGGDPFIFGRGGEEIEALIAEQIPFQVVPGITAATGCAAYAGIPLTHRDYSQSVRFVTGHPKEGHVDLEWREFTHKNQTIVFYMGLGGLQDICEQLVAHGREESTPVAVISKGTTPDQRTVIGDLNTICHQVKGEQIARPTLIIVGEVVALHDSMSKGLASHNY